MIKTRFKSRKERKVQYLDENGKWKSTGCDTIIEAKKWYYENIEKKVNNLFSNFTNGLFTDRSIGSFWWVCQKTNIGRTEAWWYRQDMALKLYILPVFGDMLLDEITTPLVQDWYFGLKGLRKGADLADYTRNHYLDTMSTIMKWAKNRGIISSNPCEGVIRIVPRQNGRDRFTPDEMAMMFPEDKKKCIRIWGGLSYACYYLIMRDTGWRPGEIAGLDVSGFYPSYNGIFTSQSVDSFSRKLKNSIKTSGDGYNYKIGVLSKFTTEMLSDLVQKSNIQSGLIFKGKRGGVLLAKSMRLHFRERMSLLGIDTTTRPPYSIRTTFMSQMSTKYDEEVVKELMGHTQWHRCYDKRTPEELLSRIATKMS